MEFRMKFVEIRKIIESNHGHTLSLKMNCPTATAPQRTPWERRDERTKPTYWGMVKAQMRKEKRYMCHRGKTMLVGNERGNLS